MKHAATIATGIAAGYLLGRTRKLKLAFTLAAVGATGKLGVRPSDLVEQRLKDLGGGELGKLATSVRGELFSAAKHAATTAATGRIDALTDRLNTAEGTESGATGGESAEKSADEAEEPAGDTADRAAGDEPSEHEDERGRRVRRRGEPGGEPAADERDEGAQEEGEERPRPVVRRKQAAHQPSRDETTGDDERRGRSGSGVGPRRATPRRRQPDEQASRTRRGRPTRATSGRH